jgi:hypothetical protein
VSAMKQGHNKDRENKQIDQHKSVMKQEHRHSGPGADLDVEY